MKLRERVEKLERELARSKHVHAYRYSKTISDPTSSDRRGTFYSWRCEADDCELGDCGTNTAGLLPTHFPAELR